MPIPRKLTGVAEEDTTTVSKRSRKVSLHLPAWLPLFLKREGPVQDAMPYIAIVVWYCFNLSVIFTNKLIFKYFPFPTGYMAGATLWMARSQSLAGSP